MGPENQQMIGNENSRQMRTNNLQQRRRGCKPRGVVDSLVLEVTESEQTSAALPEKIASILNNILASGLNEQAAMSRNERIKRPENESQKLTRKSGTYPRSQPEVWMSGCKRCRNF